MNQDWSRVTRTRRPLHFYCYDVILCRFRPEISLFYPSDMNTVIQAPATTQCIFYWMNRPFSISRGPSRECHCAFQTSLCRYIPLFALHVFLSSDWLPWCAGCFSRHTWIPLIHPSFKSFHIRRHLPPHKSHTMGVWTEENPMGRGDYHQD